MGSWCIAPSSYFPPIGRSRPNVFVTETKRLDLETSHYCILIYWTMIFVTWILAGCLENFSKKGEFCAWYMKFLCGGKSPMEQYLCLASRLAVCLERICAEVRCDFGCTWAHMILNKNDKQMVLRSQICVLYRDLLIWHAKRPIDVKMTSRCTKVLCCFWHALINPAETHWVSRETRKRRWKSGKKMKKKLLPLSMWTNKI